MLLGEFKLFDVCINNIEKFTTFIFVIVFAGFESIRGMTEENSKIAAWKFNSMDRNNDKQLSRHELREIKRDVRKTVKPKVGEHLQNTNKKFLHVCPLKLKEQETSIMAPPAVALPGVSQKSL